MSVENLPFDMILESLKHMRYEDVAAYCRINRRFALACSSLQGQHIIYELQKRYREPIITKFLTRINKYNFNLGEVMSDVLFEPNVPDEVFPAEELCEYDDLRLRYYDKYLQKNSKVVQQILDYIHNHPEYYPGNNDEYESETQYSDATNEIINVLKQSFGDFFSHHLSIILSRINPSANRSINMEVDKEFLRSNYHMLTPIAKYLDRLILIHKCENNPKYRWAPVGSKYWKLCTETTN